MPYRFVPPRSDRGSIKDLRKKQTEALEENPDMPPTPAELRIKSLYEQAMVLRDQALIDSLGLIVMGGAPDNPVSILRHRQYIDELKQKMGAQIQDAQNEIEAFFANDFEGPAEMRVAAYKQENARNIILGDDGQNFYKAASPNVPRQGLFVRSFWRSK